MSQEYPRNQMDQYRFDTNQINMNDQQQGIRMMMNEQRMKNGQMDQRQSYQMNRPNRMFDQRMNSVNQMDGQRMQYRMDPNQMNRMNQMSQMNQLNRLDNRRFKRDAESDFVAYRTMTETPFQRSHSEVVMETDPQPIQLVQGSYSQGYSMYTTAPLMRTMVTPVYMTY